VRHATLVGPTLEVPAPAELIPPAVLPSARAASPVMLGRPAAVTAAAGAWEGIAPTSLHSWPTLAAALEEARPRLSHCYDEQTQARHGPRPYTATRSLQPGTGAAVLLLQLEATSGRMVQVVDAPVESRGASEDGLLSCVQEALRGLELKGPARPGARYRVRYPLQPLVAAVGGPQILAPRVRLKPR
jgi:hypothetical protein